MGSDANDGPPPETERQRARRERDEEEAAAAEGRRGPGRGGLTRSHAVLGLILVGGLATLYHHDMLSDHSHALHTEHHNSLRTVRHRPREDAGAHGAHHPRHRHRHHSFVEEIEEGFHHLFGHHAAHHDAEAMQELHADQPEPETWPAPGSVDPPEEVVAQAEPGAGRPKGNARPEVLFDLKCKNGEGGEKVKGASGQCLGVGPSAMRTCPGLQYETQAHGVLERAPGTGGPTGCKEAWVTTLGDDGFVSAVLALVYTLRRFSAVDRDVVVFASTAVTEPVRKQLAQECVRVIVVDPFENNDLARELVAKSPRYRSGYWVVKMFVWRLEEYSKAVFLDADIYMRHNPDALFCAPTRHEKPIAVTPRSSQQASAGFNAGMFVYNPTRSIYEGIMQKFLKLTPEAMFQSSEQEFLNEFFKGRYSIVPIDFIMKHRRIVKEKTLWDHDRIKGYHMNGNPKPWHPQWRTTCAYPKDHQKFFQQYEDFFVEWWQFYYDMIGEPLPEDRGDFALKPRHDPTNMWGLWDRATYKCPEQ